MSEPRTQRILARIENLEGAWPEGVWIDSRVRLLGEYYGTASRSIQALIDDGSMVIFRTETLST